MIQTQDLIERTQEALDQAERLIQEARPLVRGVSDLIKALSQIHAELQAYQKQLTDKSSQPDTVEEPAVAVTTPSPSKVLPVSSSPKVDLPDMAEFLEKPELPAITASLSDFQLPWENGIQEPVVPTPSPSRVQEVVTASSPPNTSEERRGTSRRPGNPTPVFVKLTEDGDDQNSSYVVDRSTQGIGMQMDDPMEVDQQLWIRPKAAPFDCPWFQIIVRHCQPERGQFRVGCRFLTPLSWQHLRYFG